MNMKMNFSMDEIRLKVEDKYHDCFGGNCIPYQYRRPLRTSLYGREGVCRGLCL